MNEYVTQRAVIWWESKRPEGWTLQNHLDDYLINCVGEPERELAAAVADYLEASIQFHKYMGDKKE